MPGNWKSQAQLGAPCSGPEQIQILAAAARAGTHQWASLRLGGINGVIEPIPGVFPAALADLFVATGRGLTSLMIDYASTVALPSSAEGLETLECLSVGVLGNHPFLTDFLAKCKSLKSLHFGASPMDFDTTLVPLLARLQATHLPRLALTELEVKALNAPDPDVYTAVLAHPSLNSLESLVMPGMGHQPTGIFAAGRFTRLTRARLGIPGPFQNVLGILESAPALRFAYLWIFYMEGVAPAPASRFKGCPSLQVLGLDFAGARAQEVTHSLANVAHHAPRSQVLLLGSHTVLEEPAFQVVEELQELRWFALGGAEALAAAKAFRSRRRQVSAACVWHRVTLRRCSFSRPSRLRYWPWEELDIHGDLALWNFAQVEGWIGH